MKEAYAVRRTVPPSAEIQAEIDKLLGRGLVDDPQKMLSELARLGARLIIQRAVEEEFDVYAYCSPQRRAQPYWPLARLAWPWPRRRLTTPLRKRRSSRRSRLALPRTPPKRRSIPPTRRRGLLARLLQGSRSRTASGSRVRQDYSIYGLEDADSDILVFDEGPGSSPRQKVLGPGSLGRVRL